MRGKTKRLRLAGLLAAALTLTTMGSSRAWADEPIVGFWHAKWTDATTGAVVNDLWDAWHSDHTEMQNDIGPILGGFVCQGAWTSLGKRTYGLTHPVFNYLYPPSSPEDQEGVEDTTSSTLVLEKVTVSKDGNSFQGTGFIKQISGTDAEDPKAKVLSTESIIISATRIIVDKSQLP